MRAILGYPVLAVPGRKIPGVYFLALKRRVVYVGQTTDVIGRTRSHVIKRSYLNGIKRRYWTHAYFIPMIGTPIKIRRAIETYFIGKLRPKHNSIGVKRRGKRLVSIPPKGMTEVSISFNEREAKAIAILARSDHRKFAAMVKRLALQAIGL